ncbi:hypothetical protein LCM27_04720 [Ruegeria marisrubri]|uniref:hypothetical protein n=1 Tax=Ruegeria marisrubri TaxID=1685379 RepID=UPI001CD5EF16|nr:hypothetical protein [Ruegeria marisrubri]MCA0905694.1 hypothetical protein [Ruegeria marisrubri]
MDRTPEHERPLGALGCRSPAPDTIIPADPWTIMRQQSNWTRQMSEELVSIQRAENAGFVLQIGFWCRRERILVSCLTNVSPIFTFKYMKNIYLNASKRKSFSSDLGFRQLVYKILFQIQ